MATIILGKKKVMLPPKTTPPPPPEEDDGGNPHCDDCDRWSMTTAHRHYAENGNMYCDGCADRHEDEFVADEADDDGFEDCDCGYTHHHEDKCPTGDQCRMYEKWRE